MGLFDGGGFDMDALMQMINPMGTLGGGGQRLWSERGTADRPYAGCAGGVGGEYTTAVQSARDHTAPSASGGTSSGSDGRPWNGCAATESDRVAYDRGLAPAAQQRQEAVLLPCWPSRQTNSISLQ